MSKSLSNVRSDMKEIIPDAEFRSVVVAMFCESGNLVRDWAKAGYLCYCFDTLNDGRIEKVGRGAIAFVNADLRNQATLDEIVTLYPFAVFGAPPCTDMAVSGAKHFEAKRKKNPNFHAEACALARSVEYVGERAKCPWFAENPVSVLSTLWRKPDWHFHPWQFGGYLPKDDVHPRWPQYIKPRDAYPKHTCLWSGGGYTLPPIYPVVVEKGYSTQFKKLGGKSERTKRIRNEGPRGFSRANFLHMTGGLPRHVKANPAMFLSAITTAINTHKYGAYLHPYSLEDYAAMRLFMSDDGKSGFALKGCDLVSVFSFGKERFPSIMQTALAEGASTLDVYDGPLVEMYKAYGFVEYQRYPWDDQYRPAAWTDAFGKPDVVYMKRGF